MVRGGAWGTTSRRDVLLGPALPQSLRGASIADTTPFPWDVLGSAPSWAWSLVRATPPRGTIRRLHPLSRLSVVASGRIAHRTVVRPLVRCRRLLVSLRGHLEDQALHGVRGARAEAGAGAASPSHRGRRPTWAAALPVLPCPDQRRGASRHRVASCDMSDDLVAGTITVSYPGGKHTFHRTGPDQWVLDLEAKDHVDMPTVTGYDNGNVLRVLSSFLQGTS